MRSAIACCAIVLVACVACTGDQAQTPAAPLGLPPVPVPLDNPLTKAKIELGRKLFMDRRLSPNDTMSCAMCHVPEQGYTSNEMGTAVGIEGRSVRRNAPALYNVAYQTRLFADGRESSLETQIWSPLLARNEMGNASVGRVIERIASLDDYDELFKRAFAGRGPGMETIGQAIASFERTLLSGNSRFDRWYYKKDRGALDAEEQAGLALFTGKGGCATCHSIGTDSALFTDQRYHNTGIGWARSMGYDATYKVQLAPGIFTEIRSTDLGSISEPQESDVGRFEITNAPADRWSYKTPALRNVAATAPYMHDGSLPTLEAVIDFYDAGGIDNPGKDPVLKPLHLNPQEKRALIAFLRALTADNLDGLANSARTGQAMN